MEAQERKSIRAMAREHGLKYVVVYGRLRRGWSLYRALNTPLKTYSTIRVDFNGKEHASFAAMCFYFGKSVQTVTRRLRKGASLKVALTAPLAKTARRYHVSI